jgi:hypothetical protein
MHSKNNLHLFYGFLVPREEHGPVYVKSIIESFIALFLNNFYNFYVLYSLFLVFATQKVLCILYYTSLILF